MHKHSHYRVPQRKEREKGPEKIFEEIIAEKFPNMWKEIVNHVQEAQRVPGRINPRRNTPRYIVIKLIKIKDRDKILKQQKKNDNWHTKELLSCYQLISTETLQVRRERHDIYFFLFFFLKYQFYLFIYLLYNIVLVLPYIDMNPPWVLHVFPILNQICSFK